MSSSDPPAPMLRGPSFLSVTRCCRVSRTPGCRVRNLSSTHLHREPAGYPSTGEPTGGPAPVVLRSRDRTEAARGLSLPVSCVSGPRPGLPGERISPRSPGAARGRLGMAPRLPLHHLLWGAGVGEAWGTQSGQARVAAVHRPGSRATLTQDTQVRAGHG